MEWRYGRLVAYHGEPVPQNAHPGWWSPGPFVAPPATFGQPSAFPPQQTLAFSGCRAAGKPARERQLDETYCLVGEDGRPKPFSSVSQISGGDYEGMISRIFECGGPRMLLKIEPQDPKERQRLETCRETVARFLQETVSDHIGDGMRSRGVGEEEAEVDAFYDGSFENFAAKIQGLSEVKVSATCANVQRVLVEICSDSRYVAMKLYQIEIQSCLVARKGFLARDDAGQLEPVKLQPDTTGFAIVFNRAALQVDTESLADRLGLQNVLGLLKNKMLHVVYFQSEAALPAAMKMASKAMSKAEMALQLAQGSAASQRPPAVWVCQLGSPDGKNFEVIGNPFQVKGVLANVDDLKKAIKQEKPNRVICDADEIDIYSQKDGGWVKSDEESEVDRGKSKADCYGFTIPAGAAGAA
ncbi:unnamed protein product [Effrenium voratum]|uniref:Crinkler effector protein N-terminal domain-containing protein n=1 Tax=Effrenium voratum TaxID=2562239 RepID=A0AA36N2Q8_9DINO|nr:unnamed protein product [Effrenium voratum]